MSTLALPRPDNFRGGRFGALLESDVYNICERVKEIDRRLMVNVIDPPIESNGRTYNFAVTELCADNVERLVFRTEELDARIITQLQYLLNVPFEKRFAEAEALEAKREEERKAADLDKLYEEMGAPMLTDLERCGFIQRPISYPKRGVKPS